MSYELVFSESHLLKLVKETKDEEAKQYINKFFYRSNTGLFHFDGKEFKLYKYEVAKDLISQEIKRMGVNSGYGKRCSAVLEFSALEYLKSVEFRDKNYRPIVDFSTDERTIIKQSSKKGIQYDEYYVNMANPLPFDNTKTINKKDYEAKLKIIYNHINEVICTSNNDLYEYTLNFFSCTIKGRKLRKALYWQSNERTGKGLVTSLLQQTLGDRVCKASNSEKITQYTKEFEGKVLIILDEMPVADDRKHIADCLKSLITESTFDCRGMHQNGYQQANTFNIIITTNNDAILLTQTNNTRYIVSDISEHRIGDIEYFDKVKEAVNDENVRILFYRDMLKRYEDKKLADWNEDKQPETIAKQKKIIEALPCFIKWIKEEYVLKGKGINVGSKAFFEIYYDATKDRTSKQKLAKYIKDMGMEMTRIGTGDKREYKYIIEKEKLLKYFENKKWIDTDVDIFENKTHEELHKDVLYNYMDDKDKKISDLEEQIKQLKEQLNKKSVEEKPITTTEEEQPKIITTTEEEKPIVKKGFGFINKKTCEEEKEEKPKKTKTVKHVKPSKEKHINILNDIFYNGKLKLG